VRKSGETLSNYQERSQYDVKTNWVGLSPDALASFTDHMLKVCRFSIYSNCRSSDSHTQDFYSVSHSSDTSLVVIIVQCSLVRMCTVHLLNSLMCGCSMTSQRQ
jgi:hypothetical protein